MCKGKDVSIGRYNTIIFDFDGVVLDSNNIKRDAIKEAVNGVLKEKDVGEFVDYFIRYNGIPRRDKVEKFITRSSVEIVLRRYEEHLKVSLFKASLIPGVRDFIKKIIDCGNEDVKLFILSGGEVNEIEQLLEYNDLSGYFDGVYAAPYHKAENLHRMDLIEPVIFFGDSKVDYETACSEGIDFVFVYGATNMKDWKSKIDRKIAISIIEDFTRSI